MSTARSVGIRIVQDGKEHFGEFGKAANLLEYITTETPFGRPAPCGGRGRCGKCRVVVESGEMSPPTEEEKRLLRKDEIGRGVRLACMTRPLSDAVIILDKEKRAAGNKTAVFPDDFENSPSFGKRTVVLAEPSLEDQTADWERLVRDAGNGPIEAPLAVLACLPEALRKEGGEVTLCLHGSRLAAAEAGDTRGELYGAAVDIGTTTVAVYLADLRTGRNIDVAAELNAQASFGADVISRIHHADASPGGLRHMRERISNQIDAMIADLAARNGLDPRRIYGVALAGNTTMIHLALGLPPRQIAAAPYLPVTVEPLTLPADELSLNIAPGGLVYVLPGISAYVGADIGAAILASGMTDSEDPSLLIDIGTNGEIALGSSRRLITCSTAAGPACEGAHIRHGVGGIAGAVSKVGLRDENLVFETILGERPIGLCGSGIADLLAILLETGVVDETGRMIAPGEEGAPGFMKERLVLADGEPAFVLVPEAESAVGEAVVFTQKDVREIQLAKAAIAAGIDTLVEASGIGWDEIGRLYLAGGFGNYIDKASAVRIGLLPSRLSDRIEAVGNAAGKGALMALLSTRQRKKCSEIADRAEYVELSSSPRFQEAYIDRMTFTRD